MQIYFGNVTSGQTSLQYKRIPILELIF